MIGRVAFFAPAMRTVPLSGVPPVIMNLSIRETPPVSPLPLKQLSGLSDAFFLPAESRHQFHTDSPHVAGANREHQVARAEPPEKIGDNIFQIGDIYRARSILCRHRVDDELGSYACDGSFSRWIDIGDNKFISLAEGRAEFPVQEFGTRVTMGLEDADNAIKMAQFSRA